MLAEPKYRGAPDIPQGHLHIRGKLQKDCRPRSAKLFGDDAELLIAVPEHKVSLDDAGRESQSDVFAIVKANNRTIAVTVEGKVKESVGPAIKAWYTRTVTRKTEPVGLPV